MQWQLLSRQGWRFGILGGVTCCFWPQGEFCVEAVREGLVVAFVRWLCRTARGFADSPTERGAPAAPPALLLLLARLCLDYEATTISYILTLTDEQFPPEVSPKTRPRWPQNGSEGALNVPEVPQSGPESWCLSRTWECVWKHGDLPSNFVGPQMSTRDPEMSPKGS